MTATTVTPVLCKICGKIPGREYLRVSVDKSGRERSPAEQHADHVRSAPMFGFCLCAKGYKDVGSASPYARKGRDDFDRLIGDLEKRRFNAPFLVLWDPSRGSRKLYEWVRLIELCKDHGVKIFVNTHQRIYDPNNGRDRRTLQEDGIDSEYASAKISDGVTRAVAANAAAGKWHGRIPYGYKRLRDPDTGKTTAQVPHPTESKIVRELFQRLEKGNSLRSVAKDYAARGITNHKGTPFSAQHLRTIAVNPAYMGVRVHDVGRHGRTPSANAVTVKGTWAPLVPKRRFLAVQRILTAPDRKTNRPGRGVHMLSMIARCDVCGGPLAFRNHKTRSYGEYQCRDKGCVRIAKVELDALAERVMAEYITLPETRAQLATDKDNHALATVQDELAEARARLQSFVTLAGQGSLSAESLAGVEATIRPQIRELEQRERQLSTPAAMQSLIMPGDPEWPACDTSVKRAVARLLLAPQTLGELRVRRSATPGHPCPIDQRVTFLRADAA